MRNIEMLAKSQFLGSALKMSHPLQVTGKFSVNHPG
jgi:hypothetical protein